MTRRGTWKVEESIKHETDIVHFPVMANPSEGVFGGNTVSGKDGSVALKPS